MAPARVIAAALAFVAGLGLPVVAAVAEDAPPPAPTETTPATETVLAPVPRIAAPLPTNKLAPAGILAPQTYKLSDERTLSRWAYSERRARIYRDHSLSNGYRGRLRMRTEDGFPEVYLLLDEYVDSKRRIWVKVRLPGRPNGRTGWVKRSSLGPYRENRHQIVVNRRTLRATLFYRGRKVWSSKIGVGKAGTRTPAGRFWVREKFRVKGAPAYGTHAIGTSAYAPGLSDWPGGGVIGIHGTNQPGILPGRVSHGCVRVPNKKIAQLYRRVRVGTPIFIR
ncbi:MAG: L,D-transpeptidase [Baekduia sp.]